MADISRLKKSNRILRSQQAAGQREARATIAAYADHVQALALRNAELEAENAALREALPQLGGKVASLPLRLEGGRLEDYRQLAAHPTSAARCPSPTPPAPSSHADDLRRTIRLAGLLGVKHVVTMSGTPGSDPDAKYPSWVVNPWDGVYMDVLDYQWGVAVEFWKEIDALARENDVRVAIEMHPHNVVFSPVTLKRLVDEGGLTNVGAEMDPSHLMWQGMDVIASIKWLGPLVFHAAAKDATLCPGADIRGVLDTSFTRVPADADGKVPPVTASGATPGPRTRPGSSSPSASATTSPSGPSSCAPSPTSTPAWPSTSNTRTPPTPRPKDAPSPPRT
ncbi:TIM barrel protein [Streptomyces collinus]|uniref:TIM barrel protein n=1 Tax=Streptomyces collinus TaxID=42684 RepID=UPI0033D3C1B8